MTAQTAEIRRLCCATARWHSADEMIPPAGDEDDGGGALSTVSADAVLNARISFCVVRGGVHSRMHSRIAFCCCCCV